MHIKQRGKKAMLYRSQWVPKGTAGNTHGYSRQTFVGSLEVDAEDVPGKLKSLLSIVELEQVEARICRPSHQARLELARQKERHATDPNWRLTEAARLLEEAAQFGQSRAVSSAALASVADAFSRFGAHERGTPAARKGNANTLVEALAAITASRDAVADGHYGNAPAEGARATSVYKLWQDILETVGGREGPSLLRALQSKGFVKTKSV